MPECLRNKRKNTQCNTSHHSLPVGIDLKLKHSVPLPVPLFKQLNRQPLSPTLSYEAQLMWFKTSTTGKGPFIQSLCLTNLLWPCSPSSSETVPAACFYVPYNPIRVFIRHGFMISALIPLRGFAYSFMSFHSGTQRS